MKTHYAEIFQITPSEPDFFALSSILTKNIT